MTSSSKLNRIIDNFKFDKFRIFRKKLINLNDRSQKTKHDYGNGYFYQSFEKIKLSGLRSTKKRVDVLNLDKILINKNILDIGTNTGFLIMQTNLKFNKCIAIDWDQNNINIANQCKDELKIKNIEFICDDFLKFTNYEKFDIVLSLANHTTYDGGIKNYVDYFNHIIKFMDKSSILIFETHHPEIENKNQIENIISYLIKYFKIKQRGVYKFNNYADDNREFFILEKN